MTRSSERFVYFLLILVFLATSAYLAQAIYAQLNREAPTSVVPPEPTPTDDDTLDLPTLTLFQTRDLGAPILTPIPTPTAVPTAMPTPTPIPFIDKWYIMAMMPPNFATVINENIDANKRFTIRVGSIYSEQLEEIDAADYEAGRRGVKILSINREAGSIAVRNYDGQTGEIKRKVVTTPGRTRGGR